MHILFYQYRGYTRADMMEAFKAAGITFSTYDYKFKNKNKDDKFLHDFSQTLKEGSFDAVFSINYYPLIAETCYETNIKYLAWAYDCPLNVRRIEDTLGYPTNYLFLFDRLQAEKYREQGFDHVYHLPLAVNTQRLDAMCPSPEHIQLYQGDVAFIGSLYEYAYPDLVAPLPEYLQGYLDGICESQLNVYGCYFLDQMLSRELLSDINAIYRQKYPDSGFRLIKEELSYAMAAQITHNERVRLLLALTELSEITINLFSDHKMGHPRIQEKGRVVYATQMPYVFKTNRINLNMSLKCIPSGIPLRAVDILGSNGFLLSNYQPELLEYFEPGVDFAIYTSIDEARDLTRYFLNHDDERQRISLNGYQKVKEHFTYSSRLNTIFHTAGLIP